MNDEEEDETVIQPEEGEGKDTYPYGEYEGGRDEHLERHGFGSALLPNNDIYEGEYYHGKRHGKGMYCFKNGSRYIGTWRKGLKHGKGEFIYPDGSRYLGAWRKDRKHGHGTYHYLNGDTYEGSWYQGFRHGLGIYTWKECNVSHYGLWKEGRMEGAGVINYPYYKYHGPFERNLPKGPGCFSFDGLYIQKGFYLNVRDPKFDYVGGEDLELEGGGEEKGEEEKEAPKGIVPIWRAREVVEYKEDLLPPAPVAVPIKDSEESMLDIIDYLQKQYLRKDYYFEEEQTRNDTSPVPEDLQIDLPDIDFLNL